MSGTQTSLGLQDRMTGPLQKIIKAMDQTISTMEKMNRSAGNVENRGLSRARTGLQSASADLERFMSAARTARINGTRPLQEQFTNLPGPIGRATGAVRNFFSSFVGAAAAYLSVQALISGFNKLTTASDTYVSTAARLSLVNDGLQTQVQLQNEVYNAAQRSKSGYNDMASSVAKLNLLAEEAFSGNKEAIRFAELMGKAFAVSGASTQERQAGMYQLTQAMAAGKLQGDEFRSIMENAPLLAQSIAEFTGKSKGELKDMSAEGTITADIIKGALFKAADDIEDKFSKMPMTFGQAMTMLGNWATRAFEPILVRFNQFVNSDAFGVLAGHAMFFVNMFVAGMGLVFDTLEGFYNRVGAIGSFMAENWSIIGPIIAVLSGALIGYLGILGLVTVATWALNAAKAFQAAASMAATGATFAQTVAQHGLNAAMYAFPGTWILIAFVAVIALVVYAMVTWGNQTASVIGFITGLFSALGVYVWNVFATMWNFIISFAEFLINVFIDPTYAAKKLFYDLAKGGIDMMASMAGSFEGAADILAKVFVTAANIAIGGINGLIAALNMIPGVDIGKVGKLDAGSVSGISNKLQNMASNLKAPTSAENVVSLPRLGLGNVPAAFNKGKNVGEKLSLSASEKLNGAIDKVKGLFKGPDQASNPFNGKIDDSLIKALEGADKMGNPLGGGKGKNPTGGKLDSVGKIDDEINIADEDLRFLRDFAENRSIKEVKVTLTPTVKFEGTTVREEADIDKIVSKIESTMIDEIARSAEGAY
ncbi:tape measure protein [Mesobacillus stamsii]|uniref:Tape measure domain-containing protein n=1 Tax=Mesobacillus stamsii TaxID=225347 RepID=A0ABU0FS35_9BACI|nr:tape measure protein [Mesobacillus stamsii]MDQ0412728.1 tape measure domain-containing protein [Mesobacillus stamsii]